MTTAAEARKLAEFHGQENLPAHIRDALRDLADQIDALTTAALPMSDEQVETEFGKSYKRDLELWQLSQENKDFYLGAIAALHRLTAFRAGCKAAEEFHEINGECGQTWRAE